MTDKRITPEFQVMDVTDISGRGWAVRPTQRFANYADAERLCIQVNAAAAFLHTDKPCEQHNASASDAAAFLARVREIVADADAQMQHAVLPVETVGAKVTAYDAIRAEVAKLGGPDGH